MKRTTTEILIEVEETVRVLRIKPGAAKAEKINAPTANEILCPFCGGAFSTAENLEIRNENEAEKQSEKE